MELQNRINAFVKLGAFLEQFTNKVPGRNENVEYNDVFFDGFKKQLKLAEERNGWFTSDTLRFALNAWVEALSLEHLTAWLQPYHITTDPQKEVAVIMAGNIPLVGFHDFLSVLITGHKVLVKQSSNDKHLLPYLARYLEHVEPQFKGLIRFTDEKVQNFDAVIATGSNNTARYFKYYFRDKPAIIRNNRNSVAVLDGNESLEDLKALSEDVFRYFGLGCRNVSKLFVPRNYKFDLFFEAIYHWHPIIEKVKYANNYDYNKAVYLMSEFDFLENGFFMIKEDAGYSSPIATLFYEFYDDPDELREKLDRDKEQIQCVVSRGFMENEISFGQTQHPKLWDYADSVDSIKFLLSI
ncbi:acyl-CoA reductase [Aestuariivivens sediminicola]|uniref:acyl-CoA reductase n=1 Tax=Aestuariivivens sediminicola TaxID=2913560 RepID=UPI001F585A53|nr:acyl-CoA reductase [Aestuariivivens sediminicola]